MDEIQLRAECVRLAIQSRSLIPGADMDKTTAQLASEIYKFITTKPKPDAA